MFLTTERLFGELDGVPYVTKFIFDRNGEKLFFPSTDNLCYWLAQWLPEATNKKGIKDFLIGLDREEGFYLTKVMSDGNVWEASAFDYFDNMIIYMNRNGRLHG